MNSFALRKMTEVFIVNIHRVKMFWEDVEIQISQIATCQSAKYRALAIEAMKNLINEVFYYSRYMENSGEGSAVQIQTSPGDLDQEVEECDVSPSTATHHTPEKPELAAADEWESSWQAIMILALKKGISLSSSTRDQI